MPGIVDISVAIPCFNREASLVRCLERIAGCDPLPREVLVHCDGGWEPQEIEQSAWPFPLRVLRSDALLGPGGGRDRMIREAACELVASFDDDSWPLDVDYFGKAIALMVAFPNAAVIGADVFLDEKPVCEPVAVIYENNAFDGSASIHRRSHYQQLPGYVPLPNAYGMEEADLSLQAHAAGFQIMISPWLRAWHDRPLSDFKHSTLPWIRNESLQALLRYPWYAQPVGWLRVVRRISQHLKQASLRKLLRAALTSFELADQLRRYVRRYSVFEIYRHHRGRRRRWELITGRGETELALRELQAQPRVMYVQYTNPGAYPPLEHSSQILARRGWDVLFLGVVSRQRTALELPAVARIEVRNLSLVRPGLRQKLHYVIFALWCLWRAFWFKPHWVYVSDMLSIPAGRLLHLLAGNCIYHEHDSPGAEARRPGVFTHFLMKSRRAFSARAKAVILPNQARLEAFLDECPTASAAFCVWNCPGQHEIPAPRTALADDRPLRLLYHGSINQERFPVRYLEALAAAGTGLHLRLVGYETDGSLGYTDHLQAEAQRLGVADRFEYLGTLPKRSDLIARCAECDAGLCLLRIHGGDINMLHMAGASNKPFDYLSQGLALIVPDDAEWRAIFVDHGCAMPCDPASLEQLIATFQWMRDHRHEVQAMGRRGQELIAKQWNYESQFQPAVELMESTNH